MLGDLQDIYQQVIIDHGMRPRNFRALDNPSSVNVGNNPICGDKLTLYLKVADGKVVDASFDGQGCAISMASASLMLEVVIGMVVAEAETVYKDFHSMVVHGEPPSDKLQEFPKLLALQNVCRYPARVKCATWLGMHCMLALITTPIW